MAHHTFILTGEHIALCDLLKVTGHAPSGGAAKALIADGAVQVDGEVEFRKTAKIRAGQRIWLFGEEIFVKAG